MWQTVVNGQALKFRLNGINNQNFIMADTQTGSWWQQITGSAILGPLKGRQLEFVDHDQLSFGLWKKEHPDGRVLKPDAQGNMASEDWEEAIAAFPTVTELDPESPLSHRTLILGLIEGELAKAYPRNIIRKLSPVVDTFGDTPIILVFAGDGLSVRVFDRRIDDQILELFAKPDADPILLVDAQTGSEWDFTGRALSGPMQGRTLQKIPVFIDYWFNWIGYHPDSHLETFGMPIEEEITSGDTLETESDSNGEVESPEDSHQP